ncbi:MAG: c-type cytochrome [Pseudomonadota bacterium]
MIKRALLACALLAPLVSFAEGAALAPIKGDAAAGATKSGTCVACHGVGGNGIINPEWPKLAAQHPAYTAAQLKHFKAGERKNAVMMGQAALLSEQDMADIAAHFATLKAVPGVASKDSIKIGEKLYRAGDAPRGLPACAACHGPTGAGNPTSMYPRIGGQNAAYTANQLNSYKKGKDGERGAGKHALIMSAVATKLTDAEIAALASYVAGLQ